MPGWFIIVSMFIGPGLVPCVFLAKLWLETRLLLFLLSLQFLRPVVHRLHLRPLTVLLIRLTSRLSARVKLKLEPLTAAMLLVVARKSAIPELVPLCVVILLVFMFPMVRLA